MQVQVLKVLVEVPAVKRQVLGSNNAGTRGGILWHKLMSQGIESLLEKMRVNNTMLEWLYFVKNFPFSVDPLFDNQQSKNHSSKLRPRL